MDGETEAVEPLDWRREFEAALAEIHAAGSDVATTSDGTPLVLSAPVGSFLDRALEAADGNKAQLRRIGRSLATCAAQVAVSSAAQARDLPRVARVGSLQLQLVARVLAYSGSKSKDAKKAARKEIRGVLDRIALLLDAGNPPSLIDEGEHSPFQDLLSRELAPRLEKLLPALFRYLFKVYELGDDEPPVNNNAATSTAIAGTVMSGIPSGHRSSPANDGGTSISSADGGNGSADTSTKRSILSALRDERPLKRVRSEMSDTFKEMLLPQQLQRQHKPRHHKSRRSTTRSARESHSSDSTAPRDSAKNSDRGRKEKRPRSKDMAPKASSTKSVHQPPAQGSLSARVAESRSLSTFDRPRSTSSRTQTSLLLGNPVLRSTGGTLALQNRHGSAFRNVVAPPGGGTRPANAAAAPAGRLPTAPSAIVMRTPERPKRQPARRSERVLVAASPPLRKPTGAHRPLLRGPGRPPRQTPPSPLFK